jgi:hypothetical protein
MIACRLHARLSKSDACARVRRRVQAALAVRRDFRSDLRTLIEQLKGTLGGIGSHEGGRHDLTPATTATATPTEQEKLDVAAYIASLP